MIISFLVVLFCTILLFYGFINALHLDGCFTRLFFIAALFFCYVLVIGYTLIYILGIE